MNSNEKSELANGIFFKKPNEKAPEFVKGNVSIKVDEFMKTLHANTNAAGYVNLDLLKSKKGTFYFKVNNYKPKVEEPTIDSF